MTIEELEEVISNYRINSPNIKIKTVENRSLPSMLSSFVELINEGVPPTQQAFIANFKSKYPDLMNIHGLSARLKRAYLSYIREYHLGFLLEQYFDNVVYDVETDLRGVDYVIYHRDHRFNLHAFVNTKNGNYWRGIKNKRHTFVGHHIDLPMNLDEGKHVGKFILYTDDDIINLRKQMDNIVDEEIRKQSVGEKV